MTDKLRVGICGCGAIGSRLAEHIREDLSDVCVLTGLTDTDKTRLDQLCQRWKDLPLARSGISELTDECDLVIEAVNDPHPETLLSDILKYNCHALVMSVRAFFFRPDLIQEARKRKRRLIVPSGALAGLDAIAAAAASGFESLCLTTRKPPEGLAGNVYLENKSIDLQSLTKPTLVFEGSVAQAVECFPQNINVAATLAVVSGAGEKITVRIIADPDVSRNQHEIKAEGPSGKIVCRTENVPCRDNPKTSWLAVLSACTALRNFAEDFLAGVVAARDQEKFFDERR